MEEMILLENTEEILQESTEELESVVEVDAAASLMYLEQIAGDVRVIMTFVILTFCASCFRSWRINVTGGKK